MSWISIACWVFFALNAFFAVVLFVSALYTQDVSPFQWLINATVAMICFMAARL